MQQLKVTRPLVVTLIAVLFLLAAPAYLFSVYDAVQILSGNVPGVPPSQAYIQIVVAAVLIPLCIAIGVGLWRLRERARQLAVVLLMTAIVNILLNNLRVTPLSLGLLNALSGSLIPGGMIFLLLHPMIRAAFDRARGSHGSHGAPPVRKQS